MTEGISIDKAIKALKLYAKGVPKHDRTDFENALELGIEALKRIKNYRHDWNLTITERLPRETED